MYSRNNVAASNQPVLGKEVKRNIMMVALYKKFIINNTLSSVKPVIDTNLYIQALIYSTELAIFFS